MKNKTQDRWRLMIQEKSVPTANPIAPPATVASAIVESKFEYVSLLAKMNPTNANPTVQITVRRFKAEEILRMPQFCHGWCHLEAKF